MKLYPFSMQKHAHDIEFRKNRVWCEMHDMETGEVPWDDDQYEKMATLLDELRDLLLAVLNSRDGRISYITGQQIGLAKETVLWAANERAHRKVSGQGLKSSMAEAQKKEKSERGRLNVDQANREAR